MSGFGNLVLAADEAARTAKELAAALMVRPVREDLELVHSDRLIQVQQEISSSQPMDGPDDLARRFSGDSHMKWAPVVDGTVLPESPLSAVGAGRARGIPILAGTAANKFNMALADAEWITKDIVREALIQAGESPSRVDEYLRGSAGKPAQQLSGQVLTDRTFRIPARACRGSGHRRRTAYTYEFRWAPPAGRFAGLSIHCLDIPFVFDNLDADGVEAVGGKHPPQDLADAMHSAWVRFVIEGTPGWEPRTGRRTIMIFDDQPRTEEDSLAV